MKENENGKNSDKAREKDRLREPELKLDARVRPFTRFRTAELIVCAVCIVIGLLYVYAHIIPLSVLMPIYAVCFAAIPVLQLLDLRESGKTGFVNYIGPAFWAFLALAVIAAAIVYFVKL